MPAGIDLNICNLVVKLTQGGAAQLDGRLLVGDKAIKRSYSALANGAANGRPA